MPFSESNIMHAFIERGGFPVGSTVKICAVPDTRLEVISLAEYKQSEDYHALKGGKWDIDRNTDWIPTKWLDTGRQSVYNAGHIAYYEKNRIEIVK
jgi:hypothetical protein